jgi:hypothetical protein
VLVHGEPRLTRDVDLTQGVEVGERPVRCGGPADLFVHRMLAGRLCDLVAQFEAILAS